MSIEKLISAEKIATTLFYEIEKRQLIVPGKTEKELNDEVHALAFELIGTKTYWHKRIVRSGKNTLLPYRENPPNLVVEDDDILFFDFGPVLSKWEADVGRTYVVGNNPLKLKLKNDVEKCWYDTKNWLQQKPTSTGAEIFTYVSEYAKSKGWEFGGEIAGHIIGEFPHERIAPSSCELYIHPSNFNDITSEIRGERRNWILEIHFVDREKEIGGFFEQLLM